MEASFAFSDDDEDEPASRERRRLIGGAHAIGTQGVDAAAAEIKGVFSDPLRDRIGGGGENVAYDMNGNVVETRDSRVPGSYDFEREYVSGLVAALASSRLHPSVQPTTNLIPPSASPPPFQPNSRWNPAQGNSNGIIPSSAPAIPTRRSRFGLLGSLLPSYFNQGGGNARNVGGGNTGVFANLAARPEAGRRLPAPGEAEGPEWVPEDSQKEGPPVGSGFRIGSACGADLIMLCSPTTPPCVMRCRRTGRRLWFCRPAPRHSVCLARIPLGSSS